jgi:hypothetical protein
VTATATPPAAPAEGRTRPSPWRYVLLVVIALFAAFWIWALFFASKTSVNRIEDTAWAARAEQICVAAKAERMQLIDMRKIDEGDRAMLAERGDLVDRATDIVEQMLDAVVAVTPTDAKGQAIVPDWEADYRTYLGDRREFADELRAGRNEPFAETAVDGIPISEKLSTFAGDNRMPTCSPPIDLAA